MSIKILTDSTSDLPQAIVAKYGIEVVPLTVNFGDEEFIDGVTITKDEFFQRLQSSEVMPTTSQVTVAAFLEKYEQLLSEGHEIISIHLGSELSGTLQSAIMAKNTIGSDSIYPIDSMTTTLGLGALIVEAVKMIKQGMAPEEIITELEQLRERVRVIAAIGDLTYLKKGGRLSAGAQIVCDVLGIKPVIAVENNKVGVIHKCRGLKKAHQFMADTAYEEMDMEKPLYFGHAYGAEELEKFKPLVLEKGQLNLGDFETEIGITVGTHSGPNCVGLAYFKK